MLQILHCITAIIVIIIALLLAEINALMQETHLESPKTDNTNTIMIQISQEMLMSSVQTQQYDTKCVPCNRNTKHNLGLSRTYCDYNCADCSYCNSFIHARKNAAGLAPSPCIPSIISTIVHRYIHRLTLNVWISYFHFIILE